MHLLSPKIWLKVSLFISITIFSFVSCKKEGDLNTNDKFITKSTDFTTKFFSIPLHTDPTVLRLIQDLKISNTKKEFVEKFAANYGIPVWDKAILSKGSHTKSSPITSGFVTDNTDTIVFIPLVLLDQSNVNGFLRATINDSISMSFSLAQDYKNYPFESSSGATTASQFSSLVMKLDREVFGHLRFKVIDKRLFHPGNDFSDTANTDFFVEQRDTTTDNLLAQICYANTIFTISANWHCTHSGECLSGRCDGCEQCVDYTSSSSTVLDCHLENVGGSGTGGTGGTGAGGGAEPPHVYPCTPSPALTGDPLPPCPPPPGGNGTEPAPPVYTDANAGDPIVDLQKMMNCFNTIPDAGATYSIKLCSDLRLNYVTYASVNVLGSPGHTFLTLTKTNGTQSVTQSVGFYPQTTNTPSGPGCFKNNGAANRQHEYNAALTINNPPKAVFDNVIQVLLQHKNDAYNLFTNNCTNIALYAFNSVIQPAIVPGLTTVYIPGQTLPVAYIISSPTALYTSIGAFNASTQITKQFRVNLKAPIGRGECN